MIKNRIFEIIEPSKDNDKVSKIFDNFVMILIIINIIAVILESFSNIESKLSYELKIFENISVIIFSIEYLLRLYTSDLHFHERKKIKSISKYIKTPMAIIDLLAILPFYLPMLIPVDLRVLRILRLTRILRVFKVNRYTKSLNIIGRVLKRKRNELVITIFVTILLLLLSASIMYLFENGKQPNNFPNIIASMWWAIATLTTVGYGDVYPITIMGKILSGIIALLGVGLVALPTGIISSGFMEEISLEKETSTRKRRTKKIQKGKRKLSLIQRKKLRT